MTGFILAENPCILNEFRLILRILFFGIISFNGQLLIDLFSRNMMYSLVVITK